VSPPADIEDEELARQLAHLDELEQHHGQGLLDSEDTVVEEVAGGIALPAPEGVGEPPPPGAQGSSLAPYLAWLEASRAALAARITAHRGELERIASQWVHVVLNVARLTPEEITSIHEDQVRLREGIAVDLAWDRLLGIERERVAAWAEAPGGALTDPSLVRRLLDDVVAERAQLVAQLVTSSIDALAGLSLDLDLAQRRITRDPTAIVAEFAALRERLSAVGEELRELPDAVDIRQLTGEALVATLRRCVERYQNRLEVTVDWNGGEVGDAETAAAIAWVLQECLHHLGRGAPARVAVTVDVGGAAGVALRIAAASAELLPDGYPAWLVRSRARVAIASGRLLCGRDGEGTFVEARFDRGGSAAAV
jgi:hypothetical protein